jgi:glutathione S-transferase
MPTVYYAPASPFSAKVRMAAAAANIPLEGRIVDANADPAELISANPLGKIPTLLLDDGTALYDSRVIVEFLDGKSPGSRLIPEELRDRVAVRRWEALADGVLDAGLLVRYEAMRDANERSKAWSDKQLARIKRGMALMAADLGERPWCHAERYSLADIAVGCCLGWLNFRKPGAIDWLAEYPGLAKHYEKLMARPAFADTVPQVPK